MLLLAATTLEKIHAVPLKIWTNLGLGVLVLIAGIFVIRKAAQMNKILLSVIIFVALSCVGFNWIYARNEPAFLTPIIEKLAGFFPSAQKQSQHAKKIPGI